MSNEQRTFDIEFSSRIKYIGRELGFQSVGISEANLDREHAHYHAWLEKHYQGEMSYMERNVDKRLHPPSLVPSTLSVICARMDYMTQSSVECINLLDHEGKAYISRYALGRDYHKLIRKRLQKFSSRITQLVGDFGYRVFTDSAPVLEKALAAQAGLGWVGKHSNILHREHGSWFFLGEIFTDLPLKPDEPVSNHCGECSACMDKCPTNAIVEPYIVDARRCISYLTIEHHSSIPVEFRKAIGNRIYGCDDCQLYCPWNRFEKLTLEKDFESRNGLADTQLVDCFKITEEQFLTQFEGSPIRRIGFQNWRRNIAIALGNAAFDPYIINVLKSALPDASSLLAEHLNWAIQQQALKSE